MNPLHRRPQARQRTRIRAEAPEPRTGGSSGEVALRLYDPIDDWGGYWGVSAKEFAEVLDALPDDTDSIRLLINCPGGMVWEGLAILNMLRAHPARVTAVVEGIAASAASFIAAGVDELHMARNSELFVHRAWGFAVGNAETMTWAANDLERHDRNLAGIYQAKAGGDIEDWLAAMTDETTYGHDEAVAVGLADRVLGDDGAAAAAEARARFDLSVLASSREHSLTPAASARGGHPNGRSTAVAFTDEQLATMRTNLGLGADADENTIVEAMTEALNEQAEETPPATEQTGAETVAETPAPEPVAARLPAGVVAIDSAQLAALQASARRGDEARAEQERSARDATVNAAVLDGRIPAARAEHWRSALAADPGAADTLAGLAPGLVPVEARGHDGNPTAQASDPAAGDNYWFPGVAHPVAATAKG